MKYADINRRFTEIVAEWLAKGYSINSQGCEPTLVHRYSLVFG